MEMIKAADYQKQMSEIVLPYMQQRLTRGTMERNPGQYLQYEHFQADDEKRVVVLLHGFSEYLEKFYETAYYFLQQGCSVWMLQQRGHGFSFRMVDDLSLVQIDDYKEMIQDIHYFYHEIVKKEEDPSLETVLFGHSMGGGLSAVYIETYPDDFDKAILSSPMLEINNGPLPMWAAKALVFGFKRMGKENTYLPWGRPFDGKPDFENSCTNCKERFDYGFERILSEPHYQTCEATVHTAGEFLKITQAATDPKNCRKVKTKVLLFQAGLDHLVKPRGQQLFIRQIKDCGRIVRIENAKHEIYRCDDVSMEKYWKILEGFLKEQ